MTRLTKKQRQQLLLQEFLRRTREAPPGERVYMAVADLFEAAEVHDLNEVRAARGAAVDPKTSSSAAINKGAAGHRGAI